jgi:Predicted esterase
MANITCNFHSQALEMDAHFNVIIPDQVPDSDNIRTVYLLHGLSDDATCWQRLTSVERYARERGIAVIMPGAARSFYCDMKFGPKYYTHVAKEVVEYTRRLFKLSTEREDTFVAGLSMGGYGAFKLALKDPATFGAAVSFSGAVDMEARVRANSEFEGLNLIWGDKPDLKSSNDDLFDLAQKLEESGSTKPRMYQICGTEDFLYEDNIRFKNFMQTKSFDYKYVESPGAHTWGFWDQYLPSALDFLLATK